jgi:hypothetical protein
MEGRHSIDLTANCYDFKRLADQQKRSEAEEAEEAHHVRHRRHEDCR